MLRCIIEIGEEDDTPVVHLKSVEADAVTIKIDDIEVLTAHFALCLCGCGRRFLAEGARRFFSRQCGISFNSKKRPRKTPRAS